MRLLLDEWVPQRLKHDFPEHNVWTVEEVGLCGVKNGELLAAAAKSFDALITVDRRIKFQQNLSNVDLALIILIAKPCRYSQLKLLFPGVLSVLNQIEPGVVVEILG